ncbi:MAG: hypothetical protein HPY64_17790 [Anaerolineae bacterium]|nr:hypothetical protein [Anaerolineae bacterium]
MPDVPPSTQRDQKPANSQPDSPAAAPGSKSQGNSTVRLVVGFIVALVAILVLGFLVALILAFTNPGAAAGLEILRDFFIIVLTLEGLLIGVALIILVLQIARLINLLQNEIQPILQETGDTVRTVKGTATFVSRNVADPVIRASGFLAFLGAVLRELFRIFRLVR